MWSLVFIALAAPLLQQPGPARGDDLSSHLAVGHFVWTELSHGRADLWFDQANLGVPLFVAYPPLPAFLVAAVVGLLGPVLAPTTAFRLLLLGILVLLPISWYRGGRALGLPRLASLVFAFGVLFVQDAGEVGLGPTHVVHTGLFAQTCALVVLPWAVASVARLVDRPDLRQVCRVAAWGSMLAATHPIFALLAALAAIGLVAPRRRSWGSALLAATLGLAVLAPWLGYALAYREAAGGIPWRTAAQNGRDAAELVRWILSGDLLDADRFPWMTLGALGGLALVHRYPSARFVGAISLASAALAGGRSLWGPGFGALPVVGELNASRWTVGIQAAALFSFAAGIQGGIEAIARRWGSLWALGIASLLLVGTMADRGAWLRRKLAPLSLAAAYPELVKHMTRPGARFVVDGPLGTGSHLHRDLLPHLTGRPGLMSYATTFHATHSTYFVEYFDHSVEHAQLFGVDLRIARSASPPGDGWIARPSRGDYRLHELDDVGYFDIIRIPAVWSGDPKELRTRIRGAVGRTWRTRNLVALEPGPIHTPPLPVLEPPSAHSRVRSERISPNRYAASVVVTESGEHVLLKVSAFPWWHVSVDGVEVRPQVVMPNFMAVPVTPGQHEVQFVFHRPALQRFGSLLSLLAMLGLILGAVSRYRRPPHVGSEASAP
ncbi:MAG: YfhO family protein [Myxococcota bacterium]